MIWGSSFSGQVLLYLLDNTFFEAKRLLLYLLYLSTTPNEVPDLLAIN